MSSPIHFWTSAPPRPVDSDEIRRLLRRRKIAAMPELKEALGTEVDVTVFRKLAPTPACAPP